MTKPGKMQALAALIALLGPEEREELTNELETMAGGKLKSNEPKLKLDGTALIFNESIDVKGGKFELPQTQLPIMLPDDELLATFDTYIVIDGKRRSNILGYVVWSPRNPKVILVVNAGDVKIEQPNVVGVLELGDGPAAKRVAMANLRKRFDNACESVQSKLSPLGLGGAGHETHDAFTTDVELKRAALKKIGFGTPNFPWSIDKIALDKFPDLTAK